MEAKGPLAPKDPAKLYLLPPGQARYDVGAGNSLAAEAARRGTTAARAFLDWSLDTGGLGLLYYPVLNQDLDAVARMLVNPDVLVGVADAGAHVALTMDAGQSSYLLAHWVRDQGLLDVGRAVHKLTREGAEAFGIADRGLLAPGAYADVNVIDLDGLGLDRARHGRRLPARRPAVRAAGAGLRLHARQRRRPGRPRRAHRRAPRSGRHTDVRSVADNSRLPSRRLRRREVEPCGTSALGAFGAGPLAHGSACRRSLGPRALPANQWLLGTGRSVARTACSPTLPLLTERMETSWPAACLRSAPTVQFSLPPSTLNGS